MNVRKTALAVALAGLVGLPTLASAQVTVDGITFVAGSIFETIDMFEARAGGGVIDAQGQQLVGVGIVNRILDPGNNVLWQNGDNGRELTIYFFDYIAQDLSTNVLVPGSLEQDIIQFSGGTVRIYSDSTPNFTGAGTLAGSIASASDGNLWLELAGSPIGGIGSFTNAPITLQSTGLRNSGNPFEGAFNLTGTGLLDVTGGLTQAYFDTNTFGCPAGDGAPCPDDADKVFTSSGQLGGLTGPWAFRGTGEVQDFAKIPEPSTLALLGLGLAGLGFGARREVKKV